MKRPLEDIVVLEFSQYLAGPYAGLRLADLGARVIKIERPGSGDAGRQLATKNLFADGDSLVFHTINRNKESYAANLKDAADLEKVKRLIARADVMTHNFRPGVMEKIGLDYENVRALNPVNRPALCLWSLVSQRGEQAILGDQWNSVMKHQPLI